MSGKLLIKAIYLMLFIYDILTLPIYFIIQRPDIRAREAKRTRSTRVDVNTWIKNDAIGSSCQGDDGIGRKYMGATVNEIFSNSVAEFRNKPCLGYRALVTCPILTLNEQRQRVLRDKSFRSDFTWYNYEQVGRRVQDIASGLYANSIQPNSRALFYASTTLEWFLASQACFQLAIELVVGTEINDLSSILSIIKEAQVNVMFVSCDRLEQLAQLFAQIKQQESLLIDQIQRIVLIDWLFTIDLNEPTFAELAESSQQMATKIVGLGKIEELGVERPIRVSCTKCFDGIEANDSEAIVTLNPKREDSKMVIVRKISSKLNTTELQGEPETVFSSGSKAGTLDQTINYSSMSRLDRLGTADMPSRSSFDISSPWRTTEHRWLAEKPNKPEDVAMIVYSHGRLGDLKGVMLSHSYLSRCHQFLDGLVMGQEVHCSTLSLDNTIEFLIELCIFSRGGSIGYSSNTKTMFYDGEDLFKRDLSDLEALKPTMMLVRPFILEILRSSIQNYISHKYNPLKSFIMTNFLYSYKKFWARNHFETPIVNRIFSSELTKLFGSRLKYILSNGAVDCSETKDFFAYTVNIPIIELYGPDEAIVSLMSVDDIWDYKRRRRSKGLIGNDYNELLEDEDFPEMQLMPPIVDLNTGFRMDSSKNLLVTSSVLCPTSNSRIRLQDWGDFRLSDLPYPRGRLLIGGIEQTVCKGYFKRDTATRLSFYQDSNYITWFRTDDIARVFPNGSFEIISNLSDIIKLPDGQFISLSQVEHIIRNSQFVENVCAICDQDRKFIIALVVPNLRRLALKSLSESNSKISISMEPEPEELIDIEFRREVCNDRLLYEFVAQHLKELIIKAGFQAIPNIFHLVPEIWTPETELVTPSFEPKRSAIQNYYATDIQSIVKLEFRRSGSKKLSGGKWAYSRRMANLSNDTIPIGNRLSY